jgi:hypothetical protein
MSASPVSVVGGGTCGRVLKARGGQWLCVLCASPTRVTKKNSRPWGAGRACYRCYKREERRGTTRPASASVALVSDTPLVAVATAEAAAPAASTPSPLVSSFARYGHAILPASNESRALAWDVIGLRRTAGETIAGLVQQVDLAAAANFASLRPRWEAIVRDAATRVGVSAAHLHVVDQKLLVAARTTAGQGIDQPVHFDCPREEAAASKFSCLLVCSAGASSTALPRFEANATLSFSSLPTAMQSVTPLLQPEHYESVKVHPGDIIFFRQSTPHFGVRNSLPHGERVMLFSMLSPSSAAGQDAVQVFPWLFIGAAFGWLSREFARALVDHQAHQPLKRMSMDHGRKARNHALRCLRLWKLLDAYTDLE